MVCIFCGSIDICVFLVGTCSLPSMFQTLVARGYMANNEYEPATTVWELWSAPVEHPGMNSRNHIMFGTVSSWFFKYLTGIRPLKGGYQEIEIKPFGQAALGHASARIGTPYGDIVSSWKRETSTASYSHTLSIPLGTNATLLLPFEAFEDEKVLTITEGGVPVWSTGEFIASVPEIISGIRVEKGIEFVLLNGRYKFAAITRGDGGTESKSHSHPAMLQAQL